MPTSFPAITPAWGYKRIKTVDVRTQRREDLKTERQFASRRVQHAFEIPWPALTTAQRATLVAFMATCRGRILNDIAFSCPYDTTSYTCRLDMDDFIVTSANALHHSATLRLIEIASFQALKAAVDPFPATVPCQPAHLFARRYRTEVAVQEDYSEKLYEDWSQGVRRWTVGGDALTDDILDDLVDAWEGNKGPYESFTFTDPVTSSTYTAHFVETQLVHECVSLGVNSCRLTVEQLIT